MKTLRGHLSGSITVFVVLLTASAALGAVGALTETEEPTDPVVCVPADTEPVEDGEGVDVGLLSTEEGEDPVEGDPVGEPCEEEETEEPLEGEDGEGEDGEGEEVATITDEERAAACEEAAGIEPPVDGDEGSTEVTDGEDGEDGEDEKLTGLDNAIQHVLANCIKNPQAPGLLNALARLHENRERHEAHELAKEERAAEREARKAEREAAKAAGVHGNGNGHGGGNGNGKANGNGHGNGH